MWGSRWWDLGQDLYPRGALEDSQQGQTICLVLRHFRDGRWVENGWGLEGWVGTG